jgi:hypothetical protein
MSVLRYSGPSSYDRPDIRTTWVTTKVLSYDTNAGQGQNVYPLVQLQTKTRDAFVSI